MNKIQDYWNLTIRLFSVISRTLIGGGGLLHLCRDSVGVFYSPNQLCKRVTVIPIVDNALGTVPKDLEKQNQGIGNRRAS